MIELQFPDGASREYPAGSTGREVAASISPSLAKRSMLIRLDGALMDLDQRRYLPDDVLAKADRATMQLSLEMRSPFLSRDLAEFSAGIPAELHASDGGKAVLRAVAREMPGIEGASRAKTAFRVPLAEWLRGPLASLVNDVSAEGRLVRDGWLDGGELRRLTAAHQSGEADHASAIWTVLAAELCLSA